LILPTLNEVNSLPITLNALSGEWPGGSPQVIVVDGGSTDGTPELARRLGATVIASAPGRARQMNAGAAIATGSWLYFLHADTIPPSNLPLHLRAAAQKGLPACFSVRFERQSESWWLRLFSRLSKFDVDAFRFGDQSLFVRRQHFEAVSGYREELLLLEGHDMVVRLRKQTGSFNLMNQAVTTSSRRYFAYGIVFTQLIFMLIFTCYKLGVSHATLVGIYRWAFPSTV
jgi:rSAM/selenodomain-associated transferase 2